MGSLEVVSKDTGATLRWWTAKTCRSKMQASGDVHRLKAVLHGKARIKQMQAKQHCSQG